MSAVLFGGYSGAIWRANYAALAQFNKLLSDFIAGKTNSTISGVGTGANVTPTVHTLADIANAAEGMILSLINGVEAINTYALNQAWAAQIGGLQIIQTLPLAIGPTDYTFITTRIQTYENANFALAKIIPRPPYGTFADALKANPIIPSANLLGFFEAFDYEIPPAGLTGGTLIAQAFACANSFSNLANAIASYEGTNVTQLYDVAYKEFLCSQSAANLLQAMTSGNFSDNVSGMNSWNQVVTLPSMTMNGDLYGSASFTEQLQQQAVIKYAMLTVAESISTLLLSLRQPLASRINLTTLRNNETLVDVAARALGDFELWPQIAALNGLSPPYTGPVTTRGIAGFGSQLILPTPGTALSALGDNPSYTTNFLGNDLYIGPLNGAMPPWAGDFQIVAGYNNLRISLGRRLQTTQGTLIFHPNYGSRIPPEVGNVQTNATAAHINAFGKSALLSDPRVQSVVSAKTELADGGLVSFSSVVQPSGFSSTALTINEVISPIP